MRIAVVGAGGLGSKFAAYLAAHAEVTVLHRRQEYVDAVCRDGLKLIIGEQVRTASVKASTDPQELRDADVVVRPALSGMSSADFASKRRAIEAGRAAMLAALPKLRAAMAAKAHLPA